MPKLTKNDAEILLKFLPVFSASGFLPHNGWGKSSPNYTRPVVDFFAIFAVRPWALPKPDAKKARVMLADPSKIKTLEDAAIALNWLAAREKFATGTWLALFRNNIIVRILQRIDEIIKNKT